MTDPHGWLLLSMRRAAADLLPPSRTQVTGGMGTDFEVVVLAEPIAQRAALEDIIAEGMSGRRRANEWLRRQATHSEVDVNAHQVHRYRGRACCFQTMIEATRQIAYRQDFPFAITCPECSTEYQIRRRLNRSR